MVHLPGEPRFGSPEFHPRREVRAAAFPISIDSEQDRRHGRREEVQERAREIRRELGDPKIVLLGVRPAGLHQGHPAPAEGGRGLFARAG